jgi:hypothetical protein
LVAVQSLPQAPQFAGSLLRSTHAPPQQSSGLQALPHDPQLAGSLLVSAHSPAQHADGHAIPQPPQFAVSEDGSTQMLSQSN